MYEYKSKLLGNKLNSRKTIVHNNSGIYRWSGDNDGLKIEIVN